MKNNFELIQFFVDSFVRRRFDEMANCLADDFIYETNSIRTVGRNKFLKLQEKFDCNYKMVVSGIKLCKLEGVYSAKFHYEIYYPHQALIELDAHAVLYVAEKEIFKIIVSYVDEEKAKNILQKMIIH